MTIHRDRRGLARLAVAWLSAVVLATVPGVGHAQKRPVAMELHETPRPLPAIRFKDGDGADRTLADFRGKVVLLNIWATWCVPCREEMPTLDHLQAELGGADFEVIALSIDRAGPAPVKRFFEEVGLQALRLYIDSSGAAHRALGIVGLPTTILVGRDGSELGRYIGPAEWDSPEMVGFFRKQIERRASDHPHHSGRSYAAGFWSPVFQTAGFRPAARLDPPVTGDPTWGPSAPSSTPDN